MALATEQYHATQHANFTDGSAGRAGRAEKHYPACPPQQESATELPYSVALNADQCARTFRGPRRRMGGGLD